MIKKRKRRAGFPRRKKEVIGWREFVSFPEWGVKGIEAKADTGARTSAIHVDNLKKLAGNLVSFDVVSDPDAPDSNVPVVARIVRATRVRSSNGQVQHRYVVATRVRIGSITKVIETSLVCRKHMKCRMLLGREALSGDFVVDSSRRYTTSKGVSGS